MAAKPPVILGPIRGAVRRTGGGPHLRYRTRVSAPYAALANGGAGHGEEADGAHGWRSPRRNNRSCGGRCGGASTFHRPELFNAVVVRHRYPHHEGCGKLFSVKNRFGLNSTLYAIGAAVSASRLLDLIRTGTATPWRYPHFKQMRFARSMRKTDTSASHFVMDSLPSAESARR